MKKTNPLKATIKAVERCSRTADVKNPGWNDKCFSILKRYIRKKKKTFLCEDFREYCEGKIKMPDNLRAFGGVIMRASYHGLIRKVAIVSVKTPSSHMANAGLWMATGK